MQGRIGRGVVSSGGRDGRSPTHPIALRLVAAALALMAQAGPPAAAQEADEPELTRPDQRIARGFAGKKGVVVFDLDIDGYRCDESSVALKRLDGDGAKSMTGTARNPFTGPRPGAINILTPGTYEITAVMCKSFRNITRHNGQFAMFRVGAGEVVNIGRLKVKFTPDPGGNIFVGVNSGTLVKSIEPVGGSALAELRKLAPKALAKTVSRTMTPVGPATVKIRKF
jgi:hypothetical protein